MLHTVSLCGRGLHEMTEANTLITHDGSKRCRTCRREAAKQRRRVEELRDQAEIMPITIDDNVVDFELPRGSLGRKWEIDAKCRPMGNSKWFFAPLLEDEMCEYCQDCPVITLCWAYAVAAREQGVWGGVTEAQRGRLTLEERVQVRKQYPKLYNEYLGIVEAIERDAVPAAQPTFGEGREAIIDRAVNHSDVAESMAGVTQKNRILGNLGGSGG